MQNKIITVSSPENGKESAEKYKTTNVLLVAFMFRIYVKSSQKMSGLNPVYFVGVQVTLTHILFTQPNNEKNIYK